MDLSKLGLPRAVFRSSCAEDDSHGGGADPKAAIMLKQHKPELWPGYVTSIRQHEEKILLCCEISHKILRTDTVLQQIGEVTRSLGRPS